MIRNTTSWLILMKSLCLALAFAATAPAHSQSFPNKSVTIIVPYPPAGVTDVVTRAIAPHLGRVLGQSVVVENRTGAGGAIGLDTALRAPADGYTLALVTPAMLSVFPITQSKYADLNERFVPITLGIRSFFALGVNPAKVSARNLKDFITFIKNNPGKLNYGTPGVGTSWHLLTELLCVTIGADAVHVPYKGEGPALSDLISGQIDFMLVSGAAKSLVDAGKIMTLASGSTQRWNAFPATPTLKEQGTDLNLSFWVGYVGPAGLPIPIRDRLYAAFIEAYKDPEVIRLLSSQGNVATAASPEELMAVVKLEQTQFGGLLKSGRVKIDQ